MKLIRAALMFLVFSFSYSTAQAQPLRVVEVRAEELNCLFDSTCRVGGEDSSDTIPIPARGTNSLLSRTLVGHRGSAAAGLYVYQYRVDLRRAIGLTNVPCLNSLSLSFGPVVNSLDFDGNGKSGDEVFVITEGGGGRIGLASAEKAGGVITFQFSSPVCAGGRPGGGQSTHFFGLVSSNPPGPTTARLRDSNGTTYEAGARVARLVSPRPRRNGQPQKIGRPTTEREVSQLSNTRRTR